MLFGYVINPRSGASFLTPVIFGWLCFTIIESETDNPRRFFGGDNTGNIKRTGFEASKKSGGGELIMQLMNCLTHWHFIDDNYMLHTDGTISAIAKISGYDIYMEDASLSIDVVNSLRNVINEMPLDLSLEVHLKRRKDKDAAHRYMQSNITREAEILRPLRQCYIDHIANYLYVNNIYMVLQYRNDSSVIKFFEFWSSSGLKQALNRAQKRSEKLAQYCAKLAGNINGFQLLNAQDATKFLYESSHHRDCVLLPDNSYPLKEVLTPTGEAREGCYIMNGIRVKPSLLYFYPEPDIRLVTDMLASLPMELDLSLYLCRCDYSSLLRKSGSEEVRQGRQISDADVEGERRLQEIADWRRHVVDNGLQIFNNVFYIKLYGSEEQLNQHCNELNEQFAAMGALLESERLPNYSMVYSLPCNMYRSKFKRQDHTDMILCLLPAAQFYSGNGYEEGLVATNFTFTGFDLSNKTGGEFYHSMTIAKTGSGKGVLNCARIVQLYGLGYDFYAIEIGNTYEFLFKLLGGSYVSIDPDSSVINPFPPISEVPETLTSLLVTPTIRAMAKIFTDGRDGLSIHEIAVCEMAFKKIYTKEYIRKNKIKQAPTLNDFYQGLGCIEESSLSDKQKQARDEVLKNIKSFLDTIIGERFKSDDNLTVHDGIFGADFKNLKDDAQLMLVYMTFLSLRYGQKALFQQTPTFIIIDELHEFIRIDKETIRILCSQVARMGRKERGYINIITQEASDITNLDPALINQMHIVNLLYTESNHDKLREYFASFNERAFTTWKEYEQNQANYRSALIGYGNKWTDSFLTYPKEIMALADTSNATLQIKKKILARNQNMQQAYQELLHYYENGEDHARS